MATALWTVAAAVAALLVIWRLRRANLTVSTILREERARTEAEPVDERHYEDEPHRVGRHRKSH
ncbi:hypothetical protein [Actinokineospora iranica]|uniref:Uncharacterized protein n=1 Tax=Actinokineospora iranica TaxID=1271860 RepID=A0A1G6NZW3_9PSEU|nr:hypothetical protein [Actinokineospora iranica]SDC73278.1 hypothetical protein SAMN05216174_10435 [Actinokineospora iranica]